MKKLFFLALSVAVFGFSSCEKDETDDGYKHAFIEQNLKGFVGGESWEHQSGRVRKDFFDNYFNDLRETAPDSNICFTDASGNFILFGGSEAPTVGLTILNGTSSSATFVIGGNNNLVATQGAIEILSVDTVENIVTGRMDVTYDGDNTVNGNFSMSYCRD